MNLKQFIYSPLTNSWVYEPFIKLYTRKSIRVFNKQRIDCLDIGSIEVDENKRGQGIFKAFLIEFENLAFSLNRAVFVESIQNPQLYVFLVKKRYILDPISIEYCPNLFKTISVSSIKYKR